MKDVFKQVQKVQEQIAQVQAELENKIVSVEVGGGMVRVTANGKQHILKIQIEKDVIKPEEADMLEDLVVAGVNKAIEESTKLAQEEVGKVTSGMLPKIPGLTLPGL